MKKLSDPFLDVLPSIDLHGYPKDMIYVIVNDFIIDNIKLNNKKIAVIHGIGNGILKEELKHLFIKDKRVKRLYVYSNNLGVTIIELN